jgi:Uroporphyrinogen decarboxylase (URO-D)
MNGLERVLAALDGKQPDRTPTFSQLFDAKPINDALGAYHVPVYRIVQKPFVQRLIDHSAPAINALLHPLVGGIPVFGSALSAGIRLGFDAGLAMYYRLRFVDHEELQDQAGRSLRICDDGFGGIYAMYNHGLIGDPESWKAFRKEDPARYARGARTYFSILNGLFGGRIAVVGCVGLSMQQDIIEGMGFANFVSWCRRDPGFVRDIIDYKTEILVEAIRAVGQSGVKVIWYGDDLAYRSGPMLSPKMLEDLFGETFKKAADAAHAGGVKIVFHSCGNVLDLLPMMADWGYDGVHALEPTAGVTLKEARARVGDRLCLVGNVDITHTLVDGTREEVFSEVRDSIRDAAGGGYIVAQTNTHACISAQNLAWMVEAAHEYG